VNSVTTGILCEANAQHHQQASIYFPKHLFCRPNPEFLAMDGMYGIKSIEASGVPRNFFGRGGGSPNAGMDIGQREWGSGGGSPLVRGSGGSCNLVQEISFHIVKFS
jgi:hypothetical protein